jgi:hypothetical protein
MNDERSTKACGQCHQQKTKDEFAKEAMEEAQPIMLQMSRVYQILYG